MIVRVISDGLPSVIKKILYGCLSCAMYWTRCARARPCAKRFTEPPRAHAIRPYALPGEICGRDAKRSVPTSSLRGAKRCGNPYSGPIFRNAKLIRQGRRMAKSCFVVKPTLRRDYEQLVTHAGSLRKRIIVRDATDPPRHLFAIMRSLSSLYEARSDVAIHAALQLSGTPRSLARLSGLPRTSRPRNDVQTTEEKTVNICGREAICPLPPNRDGGSSIKTVKSAAKI